MPASSKKKCFYCDKKLSAKARYEHQKLHLREMAAAAAATTSAISAVAPGLDLDLDFEFTFESDADADSDANSELNQSPTPTLDEDINTLQAADSATLLAAVTALSHANNPPAGVSSGGPEEGINEEMPELIPASVDAMSIERPPTPPSTPSFSPTQGLLDNPPIAFEEALDFNFDFDLISEPGSEDDEPILATDTDSNPAFVKQAQPPMLDPINEPLLTDEEILEILEMELGDLEDSNEWIDMYTRLITTRDRIILQFLATRLRTHFSRQTYDDLRLGACAELKIPSKFIAWRRLRILSDLESRAYNCCMNSCVCFLGKYRNLTSCPYCQEARLNLTGSPRRRFRYSPLIPQLRALFQDPEMAKKLKYRVLCDKIRKEGVIQDVFDSEHYLTLRETLVNPKGEYHFFDDPRDIALGVATNGFTLFKRRRRGLSTAWPIIIINYNLNPRIRNQLENVLCVGVIPGPKQCKDLNSFLVPLLDELLELEAGVECPSPPGPDVRGSNFVFRAFLIILFGDIPAVAKLLMMKGHNAMKPCRACLIPGVLCQLPQNQVYYVPMAHPGQTRILTYTDLPLRTHHQILDQLAQMEAAPTQTRRKQLAQQFGLNSHSIFAYLRLINLATCAPYDAMHLLFENLVPNLIKLWTGKFKGINQGSGSYQLTKEVWELVGKLTVAAMRYIPSFFVGTLQNIALDGHLYKAEAYAFWFQYLAPILLEGRLKEPYFSHLKQMRDILALCLQFAILHEDIDRLQNMINAWVDDYKRLYYQYRQDRLPTCPLTIHALLHLPAYIRQTGPLWASWAFVMERFCGCLLPAVKNRTLPYQHLNNYVQRRAQMQIVSRLYQFPSLTKPKVNYTRVGDENITSHEKVYPEFNDIVLGRPVKKIVNFGDDDHLPGQMTKYFATVYGSQLDGPIRDRIDTYSMVRYGRLRLAGDGDCARTASLIDNDRTGTVCNNLYVKYDLLPDQNSRFRHMHDQPFRRTQYGQLLDIYYVEFVEQFEQVAADDQPAVPQKVKPYLLARVEECKTDGSDAADPRVDMVDYKKKLSPDIIPAEAIIAVVGQVELGKNHWAIVDRSSSGVRVQFVDDEGNKEY